MISLKTETTISIEEKSTQFRCFSLVVVGVSPIRQGLMSVDENIEFNPKDLDSTDQV